VDLAARLGPQALIIPSLRDRMEDIGPLVNGFLRGRTIALEPQAWRALFLYRWPGNVRELQKTVRFALVVAGPRPSIGIEHLPMGMMPAASRPGTPVYGVPESLAAATRALRPTRPSREALVDLLKQHGGDVALVARMMGRQRTLVWRWLRREGVDPQLYRGVDEDTEVQCESQPESADLAGNGAVLRPANS
jgi:transcriptional regulator with PAS, ATPase and Fis domain